MKSSVQRDILASARFGSQHDGIINYFFDRQIDQQLTPLSHHFHLMTTFGFSAWM
jgi:hypothetical protein